MSKVLVDTNDRVTTVTINRPVVLGERAPMVRKRRKDQDAA